MRTDHRRILPISPGTRDQLNREICKIEDRSLRYTMRRLIETAYADGYEDGHLAGTREAEADR